MLRSSATPITSTANASAAKRQTGYKPRSEHKGCEEAIIFFVSRSTKTYDAENAPHSVRMLDTSHAFACARLTSALTQPSEHICLGCARGDKFANETIATVETVRVTHSCRGSATRAASSAMGHERQKLTLSTTGLLSPRQLTCCDFACGPWH